MKQIDLSVSNAHASMMNLFSNKVVQKGSNKQSSLSKCKDEKSNYKKLNLYKK